jgi:hypothetical protein
MPSDQLQAISDCVSIVWLFMGIVLFKIGVDLSLSLFRR